MAMLFTLILSIQNKHQELQSTNSQFLVW